LPGRLQRLKMTALFIQQTVTLKPFSLMS
jgi:hypothetical protein